LRPNFGEGFGARSDQTTRYGGRAEVADLMVGGDDRDGMRAAANFFAARFLHER